MWEQILWLREQAGEQVQLRWVPSHLDVKGNEHLDDLALQGCLQHLNDILPLSKRVGDQVGRFGPGAYGRGWEATGYLRCGLSWGGGLMPSQ